MCWPPPDEVLAQLEIVQGDITTLSVHAIVNAANQTLLGGGGVDGAIHRAAGPGLLQECRALGGCPTGLAKVTKAYNLPARHVIHTVGPVWSGGRADEDALLASCYDQCLASTLEHDISSIAFPAISTGVYRFPKDRAATIALRRAATWLITHESPLRIVFCCFSEDDARIYRQQIGDAGP